MNGACRSASLTVFRVRTQNSIGLPEKVSAPQPDVAWVRKRNYRPKRPQTADVLLVIEVADLTLRYDLREKGRIYAEAGIPEYWIVNCDGETIEVRRRPQGGAYASFETFGVRQSVASLHLSGSPLSVGWLFGYE